MVPLTPGRQQINRMVHTFYSKSHSDKSIHTVMTLENDNVCMLQSDHHVNMSQE